MHKVDLADSTALVPAAVVVPVVGLVILRALLDLRGRNVLKTFIVAIRHKMRPTQTELERLFCRCISNDNSISSSKVLPYFLRHT